MRRVGQKQKKTKSVHPFITSLIMFITCLLLFNGCDIKIYEANPIREKNEAIRKENETIQVYTSDFIFVDETATSFFAIDEEGEFHEISKEELSKGKVGMIARDTKITKKSGVVEEISLSQLEPYMQNLIQFKASNDDEILQSANELMKRYLYNGDQDIAIKSFTVKDAKIIERINNRIYKVLMTLDVEPMPFAYYWGEPKDNGIVTGLSHTYMLYRMNDEYIFDGSYKGKSVNLLSNASLYQPKDNQIVLYETKDHSYYYQKDYIESDENAIEGTPLEYNSPIYRIHRESNNIIEMYSGDKNHDYIPFYIYKDDLYVTTQSWVPNSESSVGYFGQLDLTNKRMNTLINTVFCGTIINNIAYLITATEIKTFDMDSNKIETFVELPILLNGSEAGAEIFYVDGTKMHLWMGVEAGAEGRYVLDLESKTFIAE